MIASYDIVSNMGTRSLSGSQVFRAHSFGWQYGIGKIPVSNKGGVYGTNFASCYPAVVCCAGGCLYYQFLMHFQAVP